MLEPNERQYWLWVTRPEYYNSVGSFGGWSCHKDTKQGDLILLWRAKGKSDIGYLLQAESDAVPDDEWGHSCDYRTLYVFKNSVNIKDLRADSYFNEWSPLKINLQGRVFRIQEKYWNRLNQIAIRKEPDYKSECEEIINPRSSVLINTTTDFTANEYILAFQKLQIAPNHLQMLLANYYAPNRTLTANMMASAMGYDHYSAANLHYGKLGGLVGEKLGWNPLPKFKINVLVDFDKPGEEWLWTMKPAVAEAIEQLGWIEKTTTNPEEVVVNENKPLYEGAVRKVSVNAYERNSIARAKCLLHYGCQCAVCGAILSDIYGEIAQGYIHVHHLRQLAEVNSEYQIDPIADLRPVCPTCHSIIHLRTPPNSIEEVRELIISQRSFNHHQTPTLSPPPAR